MSTIVIKDLEAASDLDRAAMEKIRGGFFGTWGAALSNYALRSRSVGGVSNVAAGIDASGLPKSVFDQESGKPPH